MGLFGNWSWNRADDLVTPGGAIVTPNLNNFETVHRQFAMLCKLSLHSGLKCFGFH